MTAPPRNASNPRPSPVTVRPEAIPSADAGETILIVDDQAVNRQLLAAILRKAGYRLLEAMDGDTALELVGRMAPDLVLLDIMMPGKDGYAVCEALKRGPHAATPVIFLSALADATNKVRGLELGAVDYITKPFDKAEVLARVRSHLKIQRLTRELLAANRDLVEKQAALDADLRAAAGIQRSLIPQHPPAADSVQVAWRFLPCDRIGGDVFNLYSLDPHNLALYVVDVSGHGVPAAMVTVSVSQSLAVQTGYTVRRPGTDDTPAVLATPADVLAHLEREYPFERFEKFFTISYLVLDHTTGVLQHSRAGHPPPVIVRGDGTVDLLDAGGTIIGLGSDVPFEEETRQLAPGDRVYLHTDGIVECGDDTGEQFGEPRLFELLRDSRHLPLDDTCERLIAALRQFSGGRPFQDDVTLVAVEYTGRPGA